MQSIVITQGDLPELRELLVEMAGRWRLLLSAIGVTMAETDVIQLKHPNHPKLCLFEGLEQWMVSSRSPTFGKLLSALRGKVAPNLPLADHVEEMAKRKAAATTVLSEPASHSPAPASPESHSPGLRGQETEPHESSSTPTPPPNQPGLRGQETEPRESPTTPTPPPNQPVPTGDIFVAAVRGDTARVVALLDQGVLVNTRGSLDRTPLMLAAHHGHPSTVEVLLSHGPGVSLQDRWGRTPLMLAANRGFTTIVESLLGIVIDLNLQDDDGRTALHLAVHSGHTATVEVLVAAGVNPNIGASEGRTPLMLAAAWGNTTIVLLLLMSGAYLNIQDERGWTALHHAARKGHTAIVESLLEGGVDLNIHDKDGKTALIHAVYAEPWDREDTVARKFASAELLVKAGADLSPGEKKTGWTALFFAAKAGSLPLVKLLLERGADPTVQDKHGQTPLMKAASWGCTVVVESLVQYGADPNTQDEDGDTALIHALHMQERDREDTVARKFTSAELLVKAGTDLSPREKKTGWTALFFAAKAGSLPLVRLLLERGADPTVQDKEGVTAYDIAQTYGHESVMERLERETPAASEVVSEEPQPPAPSDPTSVQQQRTTSRARVFAAVRILAERMQDLALPGRAKKREKGKEEGPSPLQRSNRPPGQGRRLSWRRKRQKPTDTTESRNTRNTDN